MDPFAKGMISGMVLVLCSQIVLLAFYMAGERRRNRVWRNGLRAMTDECHEKAAKEAR